jgi:urease accessory protein
VSDRGASPAPARKAESARARGELRLGFARVDGRTRLMESYQSGCLRARNPRAEPGQDPCVVLINTGGGVTGGDRLTQRFHWGPGARAALATQAAEKVYRSAGGEVDIATRFEVEAGAHAEWLPQETILFDRARLNRSATVVMAGDAAFLGVEIMVLGRAAMGETVKDAYLRDRWKITRAGRLIYADAQLLDGPVDQLMDRAAVGAGARAMAVVLYVAPDAPSRLEEVREALASAKGRAAASAWNGLLAARFLAPDGASLKQDLLPVLSALRGGRPLPRVWTC